MAKTFACKFEPARRRFLKQSAAIGGGLSVGFNIPGALAQKPGAAVEINAWVVIRPDDAIIIRYARSEMGQGSMTSAPMLVAEELECDWRRVKIEYASANANVKRKRAWGDMASVGSRTIRNSQEYLRKAGATAREMLIAAAAQQWGVPASECSASNSFITHGAGGRRLSFGKVADAAAKLEPPKDVKLKDPKDWKLIGKSVKRIDIPDTVVGRQRYGIDVQLPGMLYAAIAQCPVFGGKLKSMDASKVEGRRGIVKVVPLETFVAVVADNWWRAKEALRDVHIEWDVGANGNVSSASLMEFYKGGLDAQSDVATARKDGDFEQAFGSAERKIEAEYYTPYLAHSCLEPMGCTAIVKDGKVELWTSTQNAEASLAVAAATAGVPLENVEVHRVQLGGGFGRRGGAQDFVRQGVAIAKAMEGTPVKMLWTREEDTQHDFYRPASLVRMKAGLDGSGKPVAWYSRVAATSIFETLARVPLKRPFAPADGVDPQSVASLYDLPHAIPNVKVEYAQRTAHVPVGFWRTVGHSQNPFVRESFMDELANAAGKDPYEYRRALLANSPKDLGILEATAKAAGWGQPLPAGVFRGIAETEAYGSYTSAVAELSVDKNGEVNIRRLVLGIDPGYAVNPDNIQAQMQGSSVFMLTAMFWGEITIKEGRVEQSNFHDYRMMRLREMPKVEVVLAPSGGFWGGVGEPGQASIAPAVCNAIFAATGKRVRSLPLKNLGLTLA
ncbi:MAG: xanthine dehydrogenase family protein molybdopterin-binding subunit [Betaproteobacteria bacterium]|nr:MAG: xanthine dehydrogenase family protein molybdopterin-binding subunit [Betaproteobacteria bacterium]